MVVHRKRVGWLIVAATLVLCASVEKAAAQVPAGTESVWGEWLSVPPPPIWLDPRGRALAEASAMAEARKQRQCPAPGHWRLFYWAGPPTSISDVMRGEIEAFRGPCGSIQRVWVSRGGRWFGYDAVNPEASDSWEVQPREAHFLYRPGLGGPGYPRVVFVQPQPTASTPHVQGKCLWGSRYTGRGDAVECVWEVWGPYRVCPKGWTPGTECPEYVGWHRGGWSRTCYLTLPDAVQAVCAESPFSDRASAVVELVEPLPGDANPRRGDHEVLHPWAIELDDGTRCQFVTGATGSPREALDWPGGSRLNYDCNFLVRTFLFFLCMDWPGESRLNYDCTDGQPSWSVWLVGSPLVYPDGSWRILKVELGEPIPGAFGYNVTQIALVRIRAVWL